MIATLVPIYGRLVLWGRRTMEQIPEPYQAVTAVWLQQHPNG